MCLCLVDYFSVFTLSLALSLVSFESLFIWLSHYVLFLEIMHLLDEQHNQKVAPKIPNFPPNLGYSTDGIDIVVFLCLGIG